MFELAFTTQYLSAAVCMLAKLINVYMMDLLMYSLKPFDLSELLVNRLFFKISLKISMNESLMGLEQHKSDDRIFIFG